MGNSNSNQLMPQQGNADLITPILDKKQYLEGTTQKIANEGENFKKLKSQDEQEPKGKQKLASKTKKIEEVLIEQRDLLPKEFATIEELKNSYMSQKEKKKKVTNELYELDLSIITESEITCISASSDNKSLILATSLGKIAMFEYELKKLSLILEDQHYRGIQSIAVSLDGEYIVAVSQKDIKLINLKTKLELLYLEEAHSSEINSVLITKDNKHVVTGGNDCSIKIFELSTLKELDCLANIHSGTLNIKLEFYFDSFKAAIKCMTFSNDDNYLASASEDGSIKVIDFTTKKEFFHFASVHKGAILSLAISEDDNYIISGSTDCSVKVFSLKSKKELYHFEGLHQKEIRAIVVSNDSKLIFCGSVDGAIKVCDLEKNEEIQEIQTNHELLCAMTMSKDGRYLCSSGDKLMIYCIQTKEKLYLETPHKESFFTAITISKDKRYIISGSEDKSVVVFDLLTKQILHRFFVCDESDPQYCEIFDVAISSNNRDIFGGCMHSFKVFDLENTKKIDNFNYGNGLGLKLVISSDKRFFGTFLSDKSFRIFNIEEHREVSKTSYDSKTDFCAIGSSICFSNDMKYIALGFYQGSIKVLDFKFNNEIFNSEYTSEGNLFI